jgi:hypothetical protein
LLNYAAVNRGLGSPGGGFADRKNLEEFGIAKMSRFKKLALTMLPKEPARV